MASSDSGKLIMQFIDFIDPDNAFLRRPQRFNVSTDQIEISQVFHMNPAGFRQQGHCNGAGVDFDQLVLAIAWIQFEFWFCKPMVTDTLKIFYGCLYRLGTVHTAYDGSNAKIFGKLSNLVISANAKGNRQAIEIGIKQIQRISGNDLLQKIVLVRVIEQPDGRLQF